MPAYHYQALTAKGQDQKGVIEADSEKQARQFLRDKQLVPMYLQATLSKAGKPSWRDWLNRSTHRGISSKALSLFTRQFATLLSAGLPIEEALGAVAEQTEQARVQGLILSVRSKVMEGHSLAAALREHPQAFSHLFSATVAAGEKTGHLDKVLMRLADYTEQQWQMKQKLSTALIYPSMIVLVAIGIVGFLLEYVVPKMIAVYGNLHQELPWMTQVLLSLSGFIQSFGLMILLAIIAAVIILRQVIQKSAAARYRFHQILLRLPLVGNGVKTANTARFARTLSILTAAGVPALEAMQIASELITLVPIKEAVKTAVARVREGAAIHLSLKQTHYFTPMSIHMIASGEASGQLDSMLVRVADQQEGDLLRLIEVALALFEPAIILIMGVVVLFIVLAVLLPIFNLNELTG